MEDYQRQFALPHAAFELNDIRDRTPDLHGVSQSDWTPRQKDSGEPSSGPRPFGRY